MRRKLDELRGVLEAFAEQRESLLLVVSTTDREVVYVHKALQGIDDASPSDLVMAFAEPFTEATPYAQAILKSLRGQMDLAAREGSALPPLPPACDDEGGAPSARLRAAVEHVASLVPKREGHRVIFALMPIAIHDREGYARLVGELVPWQGPEPWMCGLRLLVRDDSAEPSLVPGLRRSKAPATRIYELDMSPAALSDALVKEAGDQSLPLTDRMTALMQLAGLDYANRRYPAALAKYRRLYDFYTDQRAPTMAALALQGTGDVLLRQGDLEEAELRYRQGLTLAMQTQALPLLLHLTCALGDVRFERGDLHEAEGFFGLAEKIADKGKNPYARGEALEKQGIARDRMNDLGGAVVAWREADDVSERFADHERRRSVLERLISAYRTLGRDADRRRCEAELANVKRAIHDRAAPPDV